MKIEWKGKIYDCSYLCSEIASRNQNYELLSCNDNTLLVVKAMRDNNTITEILQEVQSATEFQCLYGF
jgi:hypothetical protein